MAGEGWSRAAGEMASRIVVNTINSEGRSTGSIQIGRGNHRSQPRVLADGFIQVWVTADDLNPRRQSESGAVQRWLPQQVWPGSDQHMKIVHMFSPTHLSLTTNCSTMPHAAICRARSPVSV
jgi:hypothetical protein